MKKKITSQTVPDTSPPDPERLLRNFHFYLEKQQMSENTIRAYVMGVEQFLRLYPTISHDNMKLYKCYLMEHYKPQTVNLRIRSMNCFMEFLHFEDGRIPMIHIRQKSFLENTISRADYEYLKRCLSQDEDWLYYFVIRIMATTGMRVSELVKLKAEDVGRGFADLYGKGNKSRRIYIPKMVRTDCMEWLKREGRTSGPLFLNRNGNPITPSAIRKRLKRFTYLYGLEPSVLYPHSFRHLFARSFIEICGDISMLSDILGHESIETTRIYLRRSSSEQKTLVNQIINW